MPTYRARLISDSFPERFGEWREYPEDAEGEARKRKKTHHIRTEVQIRSDLGGVATYQIIWERKNA